MYLIKKWLHTVGRFGVVALTPVNALTLTAKQERLGESFICAHPTSPHSRRGEDVNTDSDKVSEEHWKTELTDISHNLLNLIT